MSDGLLYTPAAMHSLYDDLQRSSSQLKTENANLEDNANKFHQALHGDKASAGFDQAHKSWTKEFTEHLGVLDKLAGSVMDSLNRALAADSAVGDGFQGM